jgi:hypothetical protein
MLEPYRTAFMEGFRARRQLGADLTMNPYPPRQGGALCQRRQGWADGWRVAWEEDEPAAIIAYV